MVWLWLVVLLACPTLRTVVSSAPSSRNDHIVTECNLATSENGCPAGMWTVNFVEPQENGYTLPQVVFRTVVTFQGAEFEQVEWSAQSKLCFQLLSTQYDAHPAKCLPYHEGKIITLSKVPYGRHLMTAWVEKNGAICKGSIGKRWFSVTSVLSSPNRRVDQAPCKWSSRRKSILPSLFSPEKSLAVIVLVNRGKSSFHHAAQSWHNSGLLSYAAHRLVFLQEWAHASETMSPTKHWDTLDQRISGLEREFDFSVIGSKQQVGIGRAMVRLVTLAASMQGVQHVLFLEEDFVVNDRVDKTSLAHLLETSQQLLRSGTADIVKLRHRRYPGEPFFSKVWQGHEHEMFTKETPFVSNHTLLDTMHWILDPALYFTGDRIRHCDIKNPTHKQDWFCAFSTHAGWTNNPFLIQPSFFLENIAPSALADWVGSIEGAINNSPHLWDDKCFVIAQGDGIFTHRDVDKEITDQSPYEDPFSQKVQARFKRIDDFLFNLH